LQREEQKGKKGFSLRGCTPFRQMGQELVGAGIRTSNLARRPSRIGGGGFVIRATYEMAY